MLFMSAITTKIMDFSKFSNCIFYIIPLIIKQQLNDNSLWIKLMQQLFFTSLHHNIKKQYLLFYMVGTYVYALAFERF